jgi:hypothetical protein
MATMDDHGDMATIELAIAMMADIPDVTTIDLTIADDGPDAERQLGYRL